MKRSAIDSELSLAILGLLSQKPMSGYDLRKVFLTTALKAFSASPGAIYPALRRLEADGLVEGTTEKMDTLRPRRLFALTRSGRAALLATLTRPVGREDIVWRTDGLLLRFSFMSGSVGEADMAVFLRALAEQTEGYLEELEAELRTSGPSLPFSGRAAFGHGVESYRATALWARRTLSQLKKHAPAKGDPR